MFIPIEPAFILAVQNDPELLNYAYEKNIIPVSSTTLLPTLRIISNIWQTERNNKYSSEIAHQSGIMYNKFVDLVSELSNIGDSILKSHSLYQKTMHRLCEGPDNLISRAEKIKELGAKTSKQLDQKILDRTNVYTDAVKLLLD